MTQPLTIGNPGNPEAPTTPEATATHGQPGGTRPAPPHRGAACPPPSGAACPSTPTSHR